MPDVQVATVTLVPSHDERLRLIEDGQAGDEKALAALASAVGTPTFWRGPGDLAARAEAILVSKAAGADDVYRLALIAHLAAMRRELAGDTPTSLEGLLVSRIVMCWLEVALADANFAMGVGTVPNYQTELHQRWLDRAHRRYLAAIRSLAVVRRLAIPAVHVNVASEQVNIADRQINLWQSSSD